MLTEKERARTAAAADIVLEYYHKVNRIQGDANQIRLKIEKRIEWRDVEPPRWENEEITAEMLEDLRREAAEGATIVRKAAARVLEAAAVDGSTEGLEARERVERSAEETEKELKYAQSFTAKAAELLAELDTMRKVREEVLEEIKNTPEPAVRAEG